MLAILDYGAGNLHSVEKAFRYLGQNPIVTHDQKQVDKASHVVLPGVGAFGDARLRLKESGLEEAFQRAVEAGKPVLGICLGMQLLFETSVEYGEHEGLGILPGTILPYPKGALKVPHMGWNPLSLVQSNCPLFSGLEDACPVYFVHSFYAPYTGQPFVSATMDYGEVGVAAIWQKNLFATQFHPEKSGEVGLQMLKNFAAL